MYRIHQTSYYSVRQYRCFDLDDEYAAQLTKAYCKDIVDPEVAAKFVPLTPADLIAIWEGRSDRADETYVRFNRFWDEPYIDNLTETIADWIREDLYDSDPWDEDWDGYGDETDWEEISDEK